MTLPSIRCLWWFWIHSLLHVDKRSHANESTLPPLAHSRLFVILAANRSIFYLSYTRQSCVPIVNIRSPFDPRTRCTAEGVLPSVSLMTSFTCVSLLGLSKQMPSRSDLGWICGEGPLGFERVSRVCSPHPCSEGRPRAPSYPSISCSPPLLQGHRDRGWRFHLWTVYYLTHPACSCRLRADRPHNTPHYCTGQQVAFRTVFHVSFGYELRTVHARLAHDSFFTSGCSV
ncbi:hypothetical protein EDB83DRAFT_147642 [Lactarius deliciosus]|nr:hypothetical protein EDB83DRAFT_147642 [Lactarius deliciosus]